MMSDIREIDEIPRPSPELRPAVSYLRLGCVGCKHARAFEIDGYDVIAMRSYDDDNRAGAIIYSIILAGTPYTAVVEEDVEKFGAWECRTPECEKGEDIARYASWLNEVQ